MSPIPEALAARVRRRERANHRHACSVPRPQQTTASGKRPWPLARYASHNANAHRTTVATLTRGTFQFSAGPTRALLPLALVGERFAQLREVRDAEAGAWVVDGAGGAAEEDVVVASAGRVEGVERRVALGRELVDRRVPEADAVADVGVDYRRRSVELGATKLVPPQSGCRTGCPIPANDGS